MERKPVVDTMQNLKNTIVQRMLRDNLRSVEINVLVYLAAYQNTKGHIEGIYYQDMARQIFCHKSQLYDALRSLEEKKYIKRSKSNWTDMDITILNNDFSHKSAYKEGYIRVAKRIFVSGDFYRMKAGEKLIALQLLMECGAAPRGTNREKRTHFYEKYKRVLSVGTRTIGRYLKTVRKFFNIHLKDGVFYIKMLKKQVEGDKTLLGAVPSDRDRLQEIQVNTALRRTRVKASMGDKKDLRTLMTQYARSGETLPDFSMEDMIRRAKAYPNADGTINVKVVHQIIRQYLGLPIKSKKDLGLVF